VQLSDDVSVHATVRFSIVLVPLSRSLSLYRSGENENDYENEPDWVPLVAAAAV
jgi:hypothetical protein